MKKLIYISGVICLNIIVIGGLFKVMHWPGAGILLGVGMLTFAFVVLPAAFVNSYKAERKSLSLYIVGYFCAFIFVLSVLFKMMHWPGAGPLLVISLPLPIILFLPVFNYHQRKLKVENPSNLIGVMFLLVYYSLFSALLSLNVSKDILNAFTVNIEQIENTKQAFEFKNNSELSASDSLNIRNKEYLERINLLSSGITGYIHKLKTDLIASTEKIDPKIADTIPALFLNTKDNYDIPTNIMIGTDQIMGKGAKASELKNKIDEFKSQLLLIVGNDQLAKDRISKLLNTQGRKNKYTNNTETWEISEFYGSMLISTIYKLTSLEMDMRIAESEAIQAVKIN